MNPFPEILKGGDLRSIGRVEDALTMVRDADTFALLFDCLSFPDRLVVMRAADAIEKFTLENPAFLQPYKNEIILLGREAVNKELKWHIALWVPRLELLPKEKEAAISRFRVWAEDKRESRIVRVNALQALFEILPKDEEEIQKFLSWVQTVRKENIPSLNARIRRLETLARSWL